MNSTSSNGINEQDLGSNGVSEYSDELIYAIDEPYWSERILDEIREREEYLDSLPERAHLKKPFQLDYNSAVPQGSNLCESENLNSQLLSELEHNGALYREFEEDRKREKSVPNVPGSGGSVLSSLFKPKQDRDRLEKMYQRGAIDLFNNNTNSLIGLTKRLNSAQEIAEQKISAFKSLYPADLQPGNWHIDTNVLLSSPEIALAARECVAACDHLADVMVESSTRQGLLSTSDSSAVGDFQDIASKAILLDSEPALKDLKVAFHELAVDNNSILGAEEDDDSETLKENIKKFAETISKIFSDFKGLLSGESSSSTSSPSM
ncbi:hypothetical protein TUMSATVNIG1_60920 (plasmid) [Vibrio nigripulchritudo]|uniref:hypothetical protein n=1 Tax=Vibrio nigripulchritudo TaxID=28173 RepID=UPI00190B7198|nr:hypothetical protein [Vibrio nigripulchritudo]BCL74108.1 hypothetical protein VNTUMSATTG_60450 [Vibrio nigripulchritudo]BDU35483.1 hypothetical protein TUMSATVNIG1_60920 [Vibrio nigripulchritudo]